MHIKSLTLCLLAILLLTWISEAYAGNRPGALRNSALKSPENVTFAQGYRAYRAALRRPTNSVEYPLRITTPGVETNAENDPLDECESLSERAASVKVTHSVAVRHLLRLPSLSGRNNAGGASWTSLLASAMGGDGDADASTRMIANLLVSVIEEPVLEPPGLHPVDVSHAVAGSHPQARSRAQTVLVVSDAENLTEYHRMVLVHPSELESLTQDDSARTTDTTTTTVTALASKSTLKGTILSVGFSNGTVTTWTLNSKWIGRTRRRLEQSLLNTGAHLMQTDYGSAIPSDANSITEGLHRFTPVYSTWHEYVESCSPNGFSKFEPSSGFETLSMEWQRAGAKPRRPCDTTQTSHQEPGFKTRQASKVPDLPVQEGLALLQNSQQSGQIQKIPSQQREKYTRKVAATTPLLRAGMRSGAQMFLPEFELRWTWTFRGKEHQESRVGAITSLDIFMAGHRYVVNAMESIGSCYCLHSISSSATAAPPFCVSPEMLRDPSHFYQPPVERARPEMGEEIFDGLPRAYVSIKPEYVSTLMNDGIGGMCSDDNTTRPNLFAISSEIGYLVMVTDHSLWVIQVGPPAESSIVHLCGVDELIADHPEISGVELGSVTGIHPDPLYLGRLYVLFERGWISSITLPARNPLLFTSELSRKRMCRTTSWRMIASTTGSSKVNDQAPVPTQSRSGLSTMANFMLAVTESKPKLVGESKPASNTVPTQYQLVAFNASLDIIGRYSWSHDTKSGETDTSTSFDLHTLDVLTIHPNLKAQSSLLKQGISFALIRSPQSSEIVRLDLKSGASIMVDPSGSALNVETTEHTGGKGPVLQIVCLFVLVIILRLLQQRTGRNKNTNR